VPISTPVTLSSIYVYFFQVVFLSLIFSQQILYVFICFLPYMCHIPLLISFSLLYYTYLLIFLFPLLNTDAVGRGTALQAGRSRLRFLMMSLEFFIDITLPAALWPWDRLSL